MNTQKIGCREDTIGATNDYSFGFSDSSFENSGSWQPWNMSALEGDLQITNTGPSATVSTHFGSLASLPTYQCQNQSGGLPLLSRSTPSSGPDVSSYRPYESYYLIDPEKGEDITLQSQDTLQSVVKFSLCGKENDKFVGGDAHLNTRDPLVSFGGNQHPRVVCNSSSSPLPSSSAVSSNKTRIRWTQDLHERFVECVNCLGGAEKATPKGILRLMDSEGLTIFHVKSHLQKYRMAKYMPESVEGKSERRPSMNGAPQLDTKTGMQITEALRLQLEVQRRLHEQLEIQRNLQLRIEEQGKQLKEMFNLQQKTEKSLLETQNMDFMFSDDQPASLEDVPVSILEEPEVSHFPPKKNLASQQK